jgi:hypothetical protein
MIRWASTVDQSMILALQKILSRCRIHRGNRFLLKKAAARLVSGTPEMIGERFHSLVLWIRRFFLLNDKTAISIWEFFFKY